MHAALQNPWQLVIQSQLVGSGHVECAAVLRRRDGALKATSLAYQPSEELLRAISVAVSDPASAREHGVQFNGASYTCVRADQWAIYGKKKTGGFVAAVSGQFIVFGSYSSTMSPAVCAECVEMLAEYFTKKGK
ncbi:Profilin-A [Geodia barretti]|uniref:Profilin n=1 Tax=Geodia barretti TaxID=519541 RepID=A0AA35TCA7_GEOBA|nr:Profilin-A [Geodia barretti]